MRGREPEVLAAVVAWLGAGLLVAAGASKVRRPQASASAVQLIGLPGRARGW